MTRICFLIVAMATLAGCSSPDVPSYYVTTLGADTVNVESYLRSDSIISGSIVERTPFTYRIDYTASLGNGGRLARVDGRLTAPSAEGEGPSAQTISVAIVGGQARLEREGGPNAGTGVLDVPEYAIPTLGRVNTSVFIMEQIDRQLQAGDEIVLIGPSSAASRPMDVQAVNSDSISLDFFGNPKYAWFTRQGEHHLLGASGAATTMKTEVRPAEDALDLEALGMRWAALDAAGNGIGTPSPRATAAASFAGANFEVVYSQPAKRGRDIWGGLVPYGEIWRTGANAATVFTTSRDLKFGDVSVPAGSYSLWSEFSADSAALIMNSQTGQWGTAHDPAQDIARVLLTISEVDETERFTIEVLETAEGGSLVLSWDESSFAADFLIQ